MDTSVQFERLVVLHNRGSSNADKGEKIITALRKTYADKVTLIHLQDSDTKNLEQLKRTLLPGDILLPFGGDGTVSTVVQYLLDPTMPASIRSTPVLPVGIGRMSDVARMLNGRFFRNPKHVLRYGKKLKVYPLSCVFTPLSGAEKPLTKLAIYTIGLGYSGNCSIAWNDPKFRAAVQKRTVVTRPVEFFKAGTSVLKDSEYFDITINGKRRSILDVTAAGGHILGGYYRLPSRLSDRKFFFAISDDKNLMHVMRTAAELITNRYGGGELTKSIDFTLHKSVLGHVGGETFKPPAPCEVTMRPHKEPVIMLATSPKA